MLRFKYLLVLFLIYLLIVDDVEGWRRRRRRRRRGRFFRRLGRFFKRVGKGAVKVAEKIIKVKEVIDQIKGKRSVNEVLPDINLCNFAMFDFDEDGIITEKEMTTFIEITGLTDFDEFFSHIDKSKDSQVTFEEYRNTDIIRESCSPDAEGNKDIKMKLTNA